MKKINLILTKEYWQEVFNFLSILNINKSILIKRLEKYTKNTSINYYQYLILKIFDEELLSKYSINILKYSEYLYFYIDLNEFINLAVKYKDFYNIKDSDRSKNTKDILISWINYINNINSNSKREFYKFLVFIIFTNIWIEVKKVNWLWILKYRPYKDIKINNNEQIIHDVEVIENIIKIIWSYVLKYNIKNVLLIGESILSINSVETLNNYCLSNNIWINKVNQVQEYEFNFEPKIIIIERNNYEKNLKNFFSYNKNIIFLV
jgi:hypothetical protein